MVTLMSGGDVDWTSCIDPSELSVVVSDIFKSASAISVTAPLISLWQAGCCSALLVSDYCDQGEEGDEGIRIVRSDGL